MNNKELYLNEVRKSDDIKTEMAYIKERILGSGSRKVVSQSGSAFLHEFQYPSNLEYVPESGILGHLLTLSLKKFVLDNLVYKEEVVSEFINRGMGKYKPIQDLPVWTKDRVTTDILFNYEMIPSDFKGSFIINDYGVLVERYFELEDQLKVITRSINLIGNNLSMELYGLEDGDFRLIQRYKFTDKLHFKKAPEIADELGLRPEECCTMFPSAYTKLIKRMNKHPFNYSCRREIRFYRGSEPFWMRKVLQ